MNKYKQVIYWSEEEHKFIVEVPELPGCMADGMTKAEALKKIQNKLFLSGLKLREF